MEYLRHNIRCKIINGRVFRYSDAAKEFVLSQIDVDQLKGFEDVEPTKPRPRPKQLIPSKKEIRQALFDNRVSAREFSAVMGKPKSWLDHWFNGKTTIHPSSYRRIAEALDMREYI